MVKCRLHQSTAGAILMVNIYQRVIALYLFINLDSSLRKGARFDTRAGYKLLMQYLAPGGHGLTARARVQGRLPRLGVLLLRRPRLAGLSDLAGSERIG